MQVNSIIDKLKHAATLPLLMLTAIVSSFLIGCSDMDDDYSTDPNSRLSFSVDTLRFDTVFTTVGSTTLEFKVYNPNKETLKISSVMLANPGLSNFRINVDGRKGNSFQDVMIWPQDSMSVFVEVTVDPDDNSLPFIVIDSVVFLVNGNMQTVLLEAYGQNAHILRGDIFRRDTTLLADMPYLVYDSIIIDTDATVTIEKGAVFYMHNRANWIVRGTIKANGDAENPITIRGDRMDDIVVSLPYDNAPGQWGGMTFAATSYNNVFDHVIIKNSTGGITCAESTANQTKLSIRNSQITNAGSTNTGGSILTAFNCIIDASNTEFSNASDAVLLLVGGKYRFTHCTMANYIRLIRRNDVACVNLSNNYTKDNTLYILPLLEAQFDNCIIDGNHDASSLEGESYEGEINLIENKNGEFNYLFNHCQIKTKGENNDHFINVIFEESPEYVNSLGDKENNYSFDFRPVESSSGNGKADAAIAAQYPTDRLGVSRTEHPDIGAYQHVPDEEGD